MLIVATIRRLKVWVSLPFKKKKREEGRGIQFVFLRCLSLWQAFNSHSVLRWNLPNHHYTLCSVHSQPDVAISMPFAYNATRSHVGVLRHTSKCFYFDCLWFLAVFLFRLIVPITFHTGLGFGNTCWHWSPYKVPLCIHDIKIFYLSPLILGWISWLQLCYLVGDFVRKCTCPKSSIN